jgi:hypothetical protein
MLTQDIRRFRQTLGEHFERRIEWRTRPAKLDSMGV